MTRRAPSLRFFVALAAWLAQLCLPMAHAASMASTGLGAAAWCGTASVALRAKVAQLPADIQQILESGTAIAGHADDCAQACSGANGAALPNDVAVTVALRAAGLEATVVAPSQPAHPLPTAAPPPGRGPPLSA